MKEKHRLSQLSFRQKLILTSIACLVIPALGMLYITNVYSKLIIREHSLEKSTQSLRIVQSQIDVIFEEMVSVSNFVHFDPEIKTLLEDAKTNPVAARTLTSRLEQVAGDTIDLRITLLDKEGHAYSDYSFYDYDPRQFLKRRWFSTLEQLPPYDTLFMGAEDNYLTSLQAEQPYIFMTARALREETTAAPYAYLIVSRSEASIRERFASLEEDVYLLDEEENILSNRNQELIGTSFDQLLPVDELVFPDIVKFKGQNQLLLELPLKFARWRLISVAPYEQLTERLNGINRTGLIIQTIFAVSFLFALTVLLRRFTKPVLVLGKAARRVEDGDLMVRSGIRGADEIGSLGHSFDNMLDRVQLMLRQVETEQELKRQAEIAMLQAQINPHFLFNVLSSIRLKLLMKQDEENAAIVGSLSAMLRASFSSREEFVSIASELDFTKQYMELMRFTMRYPTEYAVHVDKELLLETVPRFILQPIIENAYKHGFLQGGGRVVITIGLVQSRLTITIEDNGTGMEEHTLAALLQHIRQKDAELGALSADGTPVAESARGIGLINVYQRLKLIYGERFEMNIESIHGLRTTVQLIMPVKRIGADNHDL
ncbi:sensor histidine kinase [Paenibacillus silagei]|uniref:Two-component system sensor histidine kinase YesM n=1 Tax=Paenibacillus silagei TaxID=1670801 RepID=A0ABS4NU89_9BACL|nr:histidine kinase [Paenibacillus silagei]MBP2113630.1 two-component system sensor histidine kinase YesM [Paenibacillus silagei]